MPPAAAGREPPGPRGLPVLGDTIPLLTDPLGFVSRLARDHGDVVRFRTPGQTVYLFNHPDAIEEVLLTRAAQVEKDDYTHRLSVVLGNGLLTSEGDFWRRQRKLAQPAFHRQRVRAYGEVMVRHAERTVARFAHGEVRDVHLDMMRLTLDIVAETLFGADIGAAADTIGHALELFSERFAGVHAILPVWVPTPHNLRMRRALERLDDVVYGLIRERRGGADRGDLLSMLLRATTEEGGGTQPGAARDGGMTERQLRDEVVTLILAGHETTALVLTYALHALGTHPDVMAQLRDEIDRVLGDRAPTVADLPALVVTDRVVRETMRLYPPVWAIARENRERCTIGGFDCAPGTQLWVAEWVVHRDPRFFPEPEAFRPERWENDLEKRLPRFAYFPFGGGPRVCIGNAFAKMEAILLLVTLVRRVHLTPEAPLAFAPSVTLRPKGAVRMRVERRGTAG